MKYYDVGDAADRQPSGPERRPRESVGRRVYLLLMSPNSCLSVGNNSSYSQGGARKERRYG